MHSIGIWKLGGSGFSIRGRDDMADSGRSRRPLSADPGAWISAEALFLLERRGWEAEMRLRPWENSAGEFTSRTTEMQTCASCWGGCWRVSAGATEAFLHCRVRGLELGLTMSGTALGPLS